jgi:hypothetical protein
MATFDASIDVDDLQSHNFEASEWIGVGKVYPSDPPSAVFAERLRLLTIPTQFHSLLPTDTLTVIDFVNFKLPVWDDGGLIMWERLDRNLPSILKGIKLMSKGLKDGAGNVLSDDEM